MEGTNRNAHGVEFTRRMFWPAECQLQIRRWFVNRILGGVLIGVFGITLLASAGSAQTDEWHKTYGISGKASVHVETNDGAVRISTYEGKQVEARIETVGWRIDDSGVRIIESQNGDRVNLEARVPNLRWRSGFSRRSLRIELR